MSEEKSSFLRRWIMVNRKLKELHGFGMNGSRPFTKKNKLPDCQFPTLLLLTIYKNAGHISLPVVEFDWEQQNLLLLALF